MSSLRRLPEAACVCLSAAVAAVRAAVRPPHPGGAAVLGDAVAVVGLPRRVDQRREARCIVGRHRSGSGDDHRRVAARGEQ